MKLVEQFNQALFLLINADANPNSLTLVFAKFMAAMPMWLIPGILILGWLRGDSNIRKMFFASAITALFALLVNQIIGLFWQYPRPFMMGIGHTLIPHVADSSFPSDHMTLICGVAFGLLVQPKVRRIGSILFLLSIPVAWARIYLGVHFPLDMLGALLVTSMCALVVNWKRAIVVEPAFKLILFTYEWIFAPFIRKGWLR